MPDYQPILNISTEDARASSSVPLDTAVHLEETDNVGYMASLGFFHQVHCLVSSLSKMPKNGSQRLITLQFLQNMLRKFIYLDYYKETEPGWYEQPYLRGHAGQLTEIPCHHPYLIQRNATRSLR